MRKPNTLKERLQAGETVIGPWCEIPSPSLTNVIAAAGMDFVILDMEHGSINYETLENMIRAAESENCCPLVRVGRNDELHILKALDMGAHGIISPHVETKKDCEKVVAYTKYYPLGIRGFSSFTRAGGYSLIDVDGHAVRENENMLTGIIIENKEGLDNIDEIILTEYLDLVYIGAYDLSQSLGLPGQVDHPEIQAAMRDCIRKITDKGIAAGGYAAKNITDIQSMVDMGMQFITYVPDVTSIFHMFYDIKNEFDKIIRRKT
jgi:4-hydroxy-2-oxoheptanedioate aldolase